VETGTVYFHLAEQKHNELHPFAFLATYTLTTAPQAHIPLGKIFQPSSAQKNNELLLAVLQPIQQAATQSIFLAQAIESGVLFQPTVWTATQAYLFLKDISHFEAAGIIVRVPNWWSTKQAPRPTVQIKLDAQQEALAGLDSLLTFNINVVLPDGALLSDKELTELLATQDNLVRVRGQWVELNSSQLQEVMEHWQAQVRRGLSLAESLRLLAGIPQTTSESSNSDAITEWSTVLESVELNSMLEKLRNPTTQDGKQIKALLQGLLHTDLRSYQLQGVVWLWLLYNMQLGGCLADDMGLGKTIQVIALLLLIQHHFPQRKHLLIVPVSLIGNWRAEIARFAPTIRSVIFHSSEPGFESTQQPDLAQVDLVITTYGFISRTPRLKRITWDMIILDEAQAIKNPHSKQTRAVKELPGRIKLALTGTPIENSMLDLWSLFDFIAPALLGSQKKFATLCNAHDDEDKRKKLYSTIKQLTAPYLLRRLKSDKRIIADLPDKSEIIAYCTLTLQQATLYQKSVDELHSIIEGPLDALQRRGVVLSYLMRLKQICNHPNQWLGHKQYDEEASGKFIRLREICQLIAEKKEKVLIFTQFRELIPTLLSCLQPLFGHEGLGLHGDTSIQERTKLVAQFQQPDGPSFFVLSLKAGGTGLTLTQASHVIHFDRWWNPAVEDQATDRAYRIGQKKNVLVHKFVCSGTIEEKIAMIITQKSTLADSIVGLSSEIPLSELSNAELLKMVSLDLDRALQSTETEKEQS
jgi:SNF2 family DNA or RNA helicase